MNKKSVAQNYTFLGIMLGAMILGALFGWLAPSAATAIKPLGTVFINMMFCIVVPLVFSSIAGAVANMKSRRRAGKIMGVTVATFVITGAIAAVIMFLLIQVFPPVLTPWTELQAEEMGEYATISDMIVNFFTASDFVGLLSRRAMLPLIVFSILFGFAINLNGGSETLVAKFLDDLTNVMLKFVKIVTYYAPIAFFAIFADLVASYGPQSPAAVLSAVLCVYLYGVPAVCLVRRRQGRGEGHVPAHCKARRCVTRHVLFRRDDSDQHGRGGGDRHFQGCVRYGAAARRDDAYGRLVLLVRAEDCIRSRRVRSGRGL